MNVNSVSSNNYHPQFGNVIVEKGGEKILKQLIKEGNVEYLSDIFTKARKNFAADVYIGEGGIGVLDKITGNKYVPTGRILQKRQSEIAKFKEVELLEGSSKQAIPEYDARGQFEYLYLGEKDISDGGFFTRPQYVDDYFTPKKESSYIIRQKNNYMDEGPKERLYASNDGFGKQLVEKFNAALEIAHDIQAKAKQKMCFNPDDASNAINLFIENLIK